MMNKRQQYLLKNITEEYIKTVQPVSSKFISQAGSFGLSPATIRNEMAELEASGYISHPHTSAGRVPTEKGYRYYVREFVTDSPPTKRQQAILDQIVQAWPDAKRQGAKALAQQVALFSHGAVFIAFSEQDFYYTGLANLFAQPEFYDHELVYDMSRVVDHLDGVLQRLSETVGAVTIMVGRDNLFSPRCSVVIGRYQIRKAAGLLGILGPMRMDYQNNFNLVKYSIDKLLHC